VWKKLKSIPTAKDLKGVDEIWSPYQTVVALHLWREADLSKVK
jgi:3-methyladenine DNA glycosylase/8-oxoguanine DNA glycosylase